MGDKSARRPNNLKEHLSFEQIVNLWCFYTTKYNTKVDIRAGEQLILNLIKSHQGTKPEVVLNKPKVLVTQLANELNG